MASLNATLDPVISDINKRVDVPDQDAPSPVPSHSGPALVTRDLAEMFPNGDVMVGGSSLSESQDASESSSQGLGKIVSEGRGTVSSGGGANDAAPDESGLEPAARLPTGRVPVTSSRTSSWGGAVKPPNGTGAGLLPPLAASAALIDEENDTMSANVSLGPTPQREGSGADAQTTQLPDFVDSRTQNEDDVLSDPSEDDEEVEAKRAAERLLSTATLEELNEVIDEARGHILATRFATPLNDDPWGPRGIDRLGCAEDAKAFARLVASTEVVPPLAIAIFGSWGSGKSFFMRLVHEHVERLSAGKATPQAPEAAAPQFHRDIAQIRFNAWHYSETHLWASLVDHLFTQLATRVNQGETPLVDRLSTSRILTIESAERLEAQRRTQEVLAKEVAAAEAKRKDLHRQVFLRPSTYLHVIEAVIEKDGDLRQQVDDAAKAVGIDDLKTKAERFEKEVRRSQSLLGSFVVAGKDLTRRYSSWWNVALMCAGVPAAFALVWFLLGTLQAKYLTAMPDVIAEASKVLFGGAVLLAGLRVRARRVLKMLRAAGERLDEKLQDAMKDHDGQLERNKQALSAAEAKVKAAERELSESAAHLVSAVEDFHGSRGAGRLVKFLRARATDGHYAQHLGLVASIRRDFEELSLGLNDQGASAAVPVKEREALEARIAELVGVDSALEEKDKERLLAVQKSMKDDEPIKAPFSRLVLYIDDLDRCPPDKVVEVLQAVHMLLAFPLFAVFVAVDVRWLSNALTQQYRGMVGATSADAAAGTAAPHDYLEKIFQIPYWVQGMDELAGARLLAGLLPDDEDEEAGGGSMPNSGAAVSSPRSPSASAKTQVSEVRSLIFKPFHRESIAVFLPFMNGSPRKLLWFVNAFRVLKATSTPLTEAEEPSHDFAIITQLALASISPEEFQRWLTMLKVVPEHFSFEATIAKYQDLQRDETFWWAAEAAHQRATEVRLNVDTNMLLHYGSRTFRFCFDVPGAAKSMAEMIQERADALMSPPRSLN